MRTSQHKKRKLKEICRDFEYFTFFSLSLDMCDIVRGYCIFVNMSNRILIKKMVTLHQIFVLRPRGCGNYYYYYYYKVY